MPRARSTVLMLAVAVLVGLTPVLAHAADGPRTQPTVPRPRNHFPEAVQCGAHVPHDAIHITEHQGDQGFILGRTPTGDPIYRPGSGVVAGNGTADDPYVIEGWCILARPLVQKGVWIEDTSAHVVVRDNVIRGNPTVRVEPRFTSGIRLEHADHVTLQDNTVTFKDFGIWFRDTSDTAILGNRFAGNDFNDVQTYFSRNLTIENNTFDLGIDVSARRSVLAGYNIGASNLVDGEPLRYVADVDGASITEPAGQVIVAASSNVTVHNVSISGADEGVTVQESENVTIRDSELARNEFNGGDIYESRRIRVVNNTFKDNGQLGLRLTASMSRVANNTVRGNPGGGMWVTLADGTTVAYNAIHGNGEHDRSGLGIGRSGNLTVHHNNIADNEIGLNTWNLPEPVNVTHNWWGDASGPSGGVEDVCTGTVADGDGDSIETQDVGVCFEPWLTEPVEGAGAG